jgi:hypothetical protein
MATDASSPSMELEPTQAADVDEPTPRLLPNTFTGEAIDLDASTEALAKDLLYLRELDNERKQLVRAVSDELLKRMDKEASWTLHFPGLDVSGDTKNRREYKPDRLLKVLEELVAEGTITKDAAQKAIERNVTYKRLYGCEVPLSDASRRVSVKSKDAVNG